MYLFVLRIYYIGHSRLADTRRRNLQAFCDARGELASAYTDREVEGSLTGLCKTCFRSDLPLDHKLKSLPKVPGLMDLNVPEGVRGSNPILGISWVGPSLV
jgi:hypothetical protein